MKEIKFDQYLFFRAIFPRCSYANAYVLKNGKMESCYAEIDYSEFRNGYKGRAVWRGKNWKSQKKTADYQLVPINIESLGIRNMTVPQRILPVEKKTYWGETKYDYQAPAKLEMKRGTSEWNSIDYFMTTHEIVDKKGNLLTSQQLRSLSDKELKNNRLYLFSDTKGDGIKNVVQCKELLKIPGAYLNLQPTEVMPEEEWISLSKDMLLAYLVYPEQRTPEEQKLVNRLHSLFGYEYDSEGKEPDSSGPGIHDSNNSFNKWFESGFIPYNEYLKVATGNFYQIQENGVFKIENGEFIGSLVATGNYIETEKKAYYRQKRIPFNDYYIECYVIPETFIYYPKQHQIDDRWQVNYVSLPETIWIRGCSILAVEDFNFFVEGNGILFKQDSTNNYGLYIPGMYDELMNQQEEEKPKKKSPWWLLPLTYILSNLS